jgi:hypothetical protein
MLQNVLVPFYTQKMILGQQSVRDDVCSPEMTRSGRTAHSIYCCVNSEVLRDVRFENLCCMFE